MIHCSKRLSLRTSEDNLPGLLLLPVLPQLGNRPTPSGMAHLGSPNSPNTAEQGPKWRPGASGLFPRDTWRIQAPSKEGSAESYSAPSLPAPSALQLLFTPLQLVPPFPPGPIFSGLQDPVRAPASGVGSLLATWESSVSVPCFILLLASPSFPDTPNPHSFQVPADCSRDFP